MANTLKDYRIRIEAQLDAKSIKSIESELNSFGNRIRSAFMAAMGNSAQIQKQAMQDMLKPLAERAKAISNAGKQEIEIVKNIESGKDKLRQDYLEKQKTYQALETSYAWKEANAKKDAFLAMEAARKKWEKAQADGQKQEQENALASDKLLNSIIRLQSKAYQDELLAIKSKEKLAQEHLNIQQQVAKAEIETIKKTAKEKSDVDKVYVEQAKHALAAEFKEVIAHQQKVTAARKSGASDKEVRGAESGLANARLALVEKTITATKHEYEQRLALAKGNATQILKLETELNNNLLKLEKARTGATKEAELKARPPKQGAHKITELGENFATISQATSSGSIAGLAGMFGPLAGGIGLAVDQLINLGKKLFEIGERSIKVQQQFDAFAATLKLSDASVTIGQINNIKIGLDAILRPAGQSREELYKLSQAVAGFAPADQIVDTVKAMENLGRIEPGTNLAKAAQDASDLSAVTGGKLAQAMDLAAATANQLRGDSLNPLADSMKALNDVSMESRKGMEDQEKAGKQAAIVYSALVKTGMDPAGEAAAQASKIFKGLNDALKDPATMKTLQKSLPEGFDMMSAGLEAGNFDAVKFISAMQKLGPEAANVGAVLGPKLGGDALNTLVAAFNAGGESIDKVAASFKNVEGTAAKTAAAFTPLSKQIDEINHQRMDDLALNFGKNFEAMVEGGKEAFGGLMDWFAKTDFGPFNFLKGAVMDLTVETEHAKNAFEAAYNIASAFKDTTESLADLKAPEFLEQIETAMPQIKAASEGGAAAIERLAANTSLADDEKMQKIQTIMDQISKSTAAEAMEKLNEQLNLGQQAIEDMMDKGSGWSGFLTDALETTISIATYGTVNLDLNEAMGTTMEGNLKSAQEHTKELEAQYDAAKGNNEEQTRIAIELGKARKDENEQLANKEKIVSTSTKIMLDEVESIRKNAELRGETFDQEKAILQVQQEQSEKFRENPETMKEILDQVNAQLDATKETTKEIEGQNVATEQKVTSSSDLAALAQEQLEASKALGVQDAAAEQDKEKAVAANIEQNNQLIALMETKLKYLDMEIAGIQLTKEQLADQAAAEQKINEIKAARKTAEETGTAAKIETGPAKEAPGTAGLKAQREELVKSIEVLKKVNANSAKFLEESNKKRADAAEKAQKDELISEDQYLKERQNKDEKADEKRLKTRAEHEKDIEKKENERQKKQDEATKAALKRAEDLEKAKEAQAQRAMEREKAISDARFELYKEEQAAFKQLLDEVAGARKEAEDFVKGIIAETAQIVRTRFKIEHEFESDSPLAKAEKAFNEAEQSVRDFQESVNAWNANAAQSATQLVEAQRQMQGLEQERTLGRQLARANNQTEGGRREFTNQLMTRPDAGQLAQISTVINQQITSIQQLFSVFGSLTSDQVKALNDLGATMVDSAGSQIASIQASNDEIIKTNTEVLENQHVAQGELDKAKADLEKATDVFYAAKAGAEASGDAEAINKTVKDAEKLFGIFEDLKSKDLGLDVLNATDDTIKQLEGLESQFGRIEDKSKPVIESINRILEAFAAMSDEAKKALTQEQKDNIEGLRRYKAALETTGNFSQGVKDTLDWVKPMSANAKAAQDFKDQMDGTAKSVSDVMSGIASGIDSAVKFASSIAGPGKAEEKVAAGVDLAQEVGQTFMTVAPGTPLALVGAFMVGGALITKAIMGLAKLFEMPELTAVEKAEQRARAEKQILDTMQARAKLMQTLADLGSTDVDQAQELLSVETQKLKILTQSSQLARGLAKLNNDQLATEIARKEERKSALENFKAEAELAKSGGYDRRIGFIREMNLQGAGTTWEVIDKAIQDADAELIDINSTLEDGNAILEIRKRQLELQKQLLEEAIALDEFRVKLGADQGKALAHATKLYRQQLDAQLKLAIGIDTSAMSAQQLKQTLLDFSGFAGTQISPAIVDIANKWLDAADAQEKYGDGTTDLYEKQLKLIELQKDLGKITGEQAQKRSLALMNARMKTLENEGKELLAHKGTAEQILDNQIARYELEQQIRDMMKSQNDELSESDKILVGLVRKRQQMLEAMRMGGGSAGDIETITNQIAKHLGETGATPAEIAAFIATLPSHQEGGDIATTGPIFAHEDEFMLKANAARAFRAALGNESLGMLNDNPLGFFNSTEARIVKTGMVQKEAMNLLNISVTVNTYNTYNGVAPENLMREVSKTIESNNKNVPRIVQKAVTEGFITLKR